MNQEDSSVLELLRQAVEAAAGGGSAGGGSAGLDRPGGLSHLPPMEDIAASETGGGAVAGMVSGLAGLTGGATTKPAWTDWVARVNPIAGLIAGLFTGGGESTAATPVATYLRPESRQLAEGFGGASNPAITAVERQTGGQFRPASSDGGAQVVVQVQAMDSRSFLDHTPEIAEAVKRALLESNNLRDVLGEY